MQTERRAAATACMFAKTLNRHPGDTKLSLCSPGGRRQALSAQGDLEKAKEELKNAMTVVATAPTEAHAENEHDDEHDENHAEASAELSNEGVSQLDLRSEEARVTEAQKNERVKQQLQVRVQQNKNWTSSFLIQLYRHLHPLLPPSRR